MRCFSVVIISLSISVISVLSSMSFAPADVEALKGRTGECYESHFGVGFMKHGEVKKIDDACFTVACSEDSSIIELGCGKVECSEGTAPVHQDNTRPYPFCCPKCP